MKPIAFPSQSPQQQPYGFSFLQSLWGTHSAICIAVIPTHVLSTAPSRWEWYLWGFLNCLWGFTPLFWQQSHTLKISTLTAVFAHSVHNMKRCFSLKQLALNIHSLFGCTSKKKMLLNIHDFEREIVSPSSFGGYYYFYPISKLHSIRKRKRLFHVKTASMLFSYPCNNLY